MNRNTEKTDLILKDASTMLLQELQAGKSDKLEKLLKFSSQFHKYSWNNQILIMIQNENATHVAGAVQWSTMGFQVKNWNAINILAPVRLTYIDVKEGNVTKRVFWKFMTAEQRASKNQHKQALFGFREVQVYDISDCDNKTGQTIPEFFEKIGNNYKDKYEKLVKVIELDNIIVKEINGLGETQGVSKNGFIDIKAETDFDNKLLTLIHEYAHEILHQKNKKNDIDELLDTNRSNQEMQAEAVSYIVSNWFGFRNPFASDYILNWGNSVKDLQNNLNIVISAANYIIKKYEEFEKNNKRAAA